ncbi:hypothetical protein JD292_10380 [Leucobacter sp. CSA2]|uniref:Uncharacterized protein n=1 Tax=Leucobacter edaphi TaxID=2796472 RepID=A0A934UYN6_9MICO|nr:hypothetical protein [Leucobacter edaphi]MBK0422477.1 hypothetical protein [Leucobacter edaphi]
MSRQRKHALAGDGPIVGRARASLRRVAEQFGTIEAADRTSVRVRTSEGVPLTLSYSPGNYVFSRVYNLTVTAELPPESEVPAGIEVSHRGRGGAHFIASSGPANTGAFGVPGGPANSSGRAVDRALVASPRLGALNAAVREHLAGIDLVSARITAERGTRSVTITPLGGSFVWVLIPPVFHATAFPAGEPRRIIDLVAALRGFHPVAA